MTSAKEDYLFLRALRSESVKRPPIWMMRQAGRYLPEYRQVRKQAGSFMDLCRSPELCTKVALQPIDKFGFDAAILFSDILTIPDAMGLGLDFIEGKGPIFAKTITTESDLKALKTIVVERDLSYVLQALTMTKKTLAGRVPLIGFSGSPWTLAVYMIEGRSSKHDNFSSVKALLAQNPSLVISLLKHNTQAVIDYLLAQADAGAEALQIFDTWASLLDADEYRQYSLEFIDEVISEVRRCTQVPIILYARKHNIELLAESQANCLSVDQHTSLSQATQAVAGKNIALQGNLKPDFLEQNDESVLTREIEKVLQQAPKKGYIFNLGHGVTPQASSEMVKLMVDRVKELSVRKAI